MKAIILLFVLITTSVQLAQIITKQEIEEINQAVTNSFGNDYGVSTIVPFDKIEKSIGQYGYTVEDSYTLRECFIFIAYTKIPEDDYNTYALLGIYKNGSIIWNSDPVIKWELLSQTSIPSIMV